MKRTLITIISVDAPYVFQPLADTTDRVERVKTLEQIADCSRGSCEKLRQQHDKRPGMDRVIPLINKRKAAEP